MGNSAQPAQLSAPQRRRRGLSPTLAIGALVFTLYFGSQALNALVQQPADGEEPVAGRPVDLGPLTLVLRPGWQLGVSSAGAPAINKGSVSIIVQAYGVATDARAVYAAYVDHDLAIGATGFAATAPDELSIGGLAAARGAYNGVLGGIGQVEGEVTTVVARDQGYVFDARGPMGTLHSVRGEANDMLDTIVAKQ